MPHEIHPDTPPEGRNITELFSRFDVDHVIGECRRRGEPYGIQFGELTWLSNSRLALEAGEYARAAGRYDQFHHAIFKAYFKDCRDIGNRDVLSDVAVESDLEVDPMHTALDNGQFARLVEQGTETARRIGATAVPTFIIEDLPPIIGAVREDVFRQALNKVTTR